MAALVSALQLGLLGEPELYLSAQSRHAYFGTLVKRANGTMMSGMHDVVDMPMVLRGLDRARDSFISQATFQQRRRRIAFLSEIGLVWADLDCPLLRERRSEYGEAHVIEYVLRAIDDERIPTPSIIVASGRGYHAKWLFEGPVPWQALERWSALEKHIVARLHDVLQADKNCTDAARVLRLVDTVNTKNGEMAHVAWENRVAGEIVRYPFDRLCDEVFGTLRPSHHERFVEPNVVVASEKSALAARPRAGIATYTQASLWWARYRDLRRLCELRGWTGERGVPEGYRDLVLFFGATALTWFAPQKTWWLETAALASQFTPTLRGEEWRGYVGATHRRMMSSSVPGVEQRYRYSTARIVSDLAISTVEQKELQVLVAPGLATERKRERDRIGREERRRAAGAVPRDVYVARAEERAVEARELSESGLSIRTIAKRLGASKSEVARLLGKASVPGPSRCIVLAEPSASVSEPNSVPIRESASSASRTLERSFEDALLDEVSGYEATGRAVGRKACRETVDAFEPTFFMEKRRAPQVEIP